MRIHGGPLEHRARDQRGVAHAELGDDLAAERIAEKRDATESYRADPGGQRIGKRRHVEDLRGFCAQPEARQIGDVDAEDLRESRRRGHEVTARDTDAVDEHDSRGVGRQMARADACVHPHGADVRPVTPEPFRDEIPLHVRFHASVVQSMAILWRGKSYTLHATCR